MYDLLSLEIWSITFPVGLQIQHAEDLTTFFPFSLSTFTLGLDAAVLTCLAVLINGAALGELCLAALTRSTAHIPPPVNPIPILEPDVPKTLPKPNISYPSIRNDQKSRDKASNQMEKIFQIFQDLRFDISFADALLLMPRFSPTIKNLLMNKEKLLELAKIPLNKNCSAMLLKKLPKKLGDPGKFLIPCNFSGMDVCHALADLGVSINLMPLSI
ncbi:hypothetical protein Tco_0115522 [Tanacetum coccineum]